MISGTIESSARSEPWLPPPAWWAPPESANSQPGAADTITSPAVGQRSAPSIRSRAFGCSCGCSRSASPSTVNRLPRASTTAGPAPEAQLAVAAADEQPAVLHVHGQLGGRLLEHALGDARRRLPGAVEPVHHRQPVGRGHRQLAALGVGAAAGAKERRALERRRGVGGLQHRALGVVGDHDHGVAVEEALEPARRLDQEPQAVVGALDRAEHVSGRPVLGGIGLVQVEEEEVEPVPGHQPAADGAAVAVDAAAEVARGAGEVGEEQVAEEVAARAVHGIHDPHAAGEPAGHRPRDRVADAAAAHVGVHPGRHEAGVLERLEYRRRPRRQVHQVQVHEDVVDHLARALGERCGERRAVLDQAPLAAVVPAHPGDVRSDRVLAGQEGGQAHGRERRERGDAVVAALAGGGQLGDRRGAPRGDGAVEQVRPQAVDHGQDQLLGGSGIAHVVIAGRAGRGTSGRRAGAGGRAASPRRPPAGSRRTG